MKKLATVVVAYLALVVCLGDVWAESLELGHGISVDAAARKNVTPPPPLGSHPERGLLPSKLPIKFSKIRKLSAALRLGKHQVA